MIKNIILTACIFCTLFSLSITYWVIKEKKQNSSKIRRMSLDQEGNYFFITLRLNGKDAIFLIDTGASSSILDSAQSDSYNCYKYIIDRKLLGVGGAKNYYYALNVNLLDSSKSKLDVNLDIVDLSSLVQTMSNEYNLDIQGILGSDFFYEYDAKINYRDQTISYTDK
jgi:hypothetical protein